MAVDNIDPNFGFTITNYIFSPVVKLLGLVHSVDFPISFFIQSSGFGLAGSRVGLCRGELN